VILRCPTNFPSHDLHVTLKRWFVVCETGLVFRSSPHRVYIINTSGWTRSARIHFRPLANYKRGRGCPNDLSTFSHLPSSYSSDSVCNTAASPLLIKSHNQSTMSGTIFLNGNGVIVSARGPGKLHLLSFASNANIQNHVGTITTTSEGITRFIISHSYTFTKFAFYWDGAGEAVCGKGQDLVRQPVGKGWDAATSVNWGSTDFTTQNVASSTTSAVNRDNAVTCFIVPDNLL